jgi:fibronectin type 3 domain-containing protein
LTSAPLKATTFKDTRVEYGVERCYIVRTAETMGALSVESEGSAPTCVKAADVFPPAAPRSLAAVSSAGAISLIWEGSEDPDLAGYIVLRGTLPGEPSERLTPEPVRETTFRDTTVKPGVRYVYAVVAVDTATPPNASEPSNRIEETAR